MTSGFVDIGGLDMYYQRHGSGAPLVLLHGAMGTIESCFSGLLSVLAENFEVIAIELQGHGHTRDIDRPLTYKGMARDTVALLDALGIKRARDPSRHHARRARGPCRVAFLDDRFVPIALEPDLECLCNT